MAGEGAALKVVSSQSEAASFAEVDDTGLPMIQISCAATELIPTRQYANVTIGPVVVKRWIPDIGEENLKQEIRKTQALCEEAVAEDRQTVHALIRQSDGGRTE
jgi:hypothetical protein